MSHFCDSSGGVSGRFAVQVRPPVVCSSNTGYFRVFILAYLRVFKASQKRRVPGDAVAPYEYWEDFGKGGCRMAIERSALWMSHENHKQGRVVPWPSKCMVRKLITCSEAIRGLSFRPAFFQGRNASVKLWLWVRTPARTRYGTKVVLTRAIVSQRGYWLNTSRARRLRPLSKVFRHTHTAGKFYPIGRIFESPHDEISADWHLLDRSELNLPPVHGTGE